MFIFLEKCYFDQENLDNKKIKKDSESEATSNLIQNESARLSDCSIDSIIN